MKTRCLSFMLLIGFSDIVLQIFGAHCMHLIMFYALVWVLWNCLPDVLHHDMYAYGTSYPKYEHNLNDYKQRW